jgi:hypothetical protein
MFFTIPLSTPQDITISIFTFHTQFLGPSPTRTNGYPAPDWEEVPCSRTELGRRNPSPTRRNGYPASGWESSPARISHSGRWPQSVLGPMGRHKIPSGPKCPMLSRSLPRVRRMTLVPRLVLVRLPYTRYPNHHHGYCPSASANAMSRYCFSR